MSSELLTADSEGINRAVQLVREGGVIAFPTDTVFGLGAAADQPSAISRLRQVKRRTQPFILMSASLAEMEPFVTWTAAAQEWASRFWPGRLTLIIPAKDPGRSLGGGDTIGVRIPDHPVALELLRQSGPLATTSANRHGRTPVLDAASALSELPGLAGALADRQQLSGTLAPSSILDLTRDPPILIREGALSVGELGLPAAEQEPRSRRD